MFETEGGNQVLVYEPAGTCLLGAVGADEVRIEMNEEQRGYRLHREGCISKLMGNQVPAHWVPSGLWSLKLKAFKRRSDISRKVQRWNSCDSDQILANKRTQSPLHTSVILDWKKVSFLG